MRDRAVPNLPSRDFDATAVFSGSLPEARVGFPRLHPVTRESWGGRVGSLVDIDGAQLNLIGER